MRDQCSIVFWAWICSMWGGVHPFAATGAIVGCCFFLASPKATTLGQKCYLGVFSYGMGYAGAIFFYGGGPPYSEKAMLVAGSISALIATVFTAAGYMVERDGDLPAWVKSIFDRLPIFKQRGGDDGN